VGVKSGFVEVEGEGHTVEKGGFIYFGEAVFDI
jgi:hypothetical protein